MGQGSGFFLFFEIFMLFTAKYNFSNSMANIEIEKPLEYVILCLLPRNKKGPNEFALKTGIE